MRKSFKIFLSLVLFFAGWLVAGISQPSTAIADTGELTLHAMINHNWIAGYDLPADIQVDVTINGGDKADFSIETDNDGHFFAEGWQYWPSQWIARGDIIEVIYDDMVTSMAVQDINAEVDLDSNQVIGTAFTSDGMPLAGRRLHMSIYEEWGPDNPVLHHYESIVKESGNFEIGGDPEVFTIQKGYKLHLLLNDCPDGNYTGHITSMEPYNEDSGFSGGDGTPENPYQIASAEQLDNVRHYLDAHFKLTTDIDLGAWSNGDGWDPIGTYSNMFAGVFDGDGHVIYNLTINCPEEDEVGLFSGLEPYGEIRNVGIENINVSGKGIVGGLLGANRGTIDNCYATGLVAGEWNVGGLVGYNDYGVIVLSHAEVDVNSQIDGGGLVGQNSGGIYNCFATGDIYGAETTGGLVGVNDPEAIISTSYATGHVNGIQLVGGLAGVNIGATISNCYATGNVTGVEESERGGDYIGGLVGVNGVKFLTAGNEETYIGFVDNSYAVGVVSGGDFVGGLFGSQGLLIYEAVLDEIVGPIDIGATENSFWNTTVNSPGLTGVGFGDDAGINGKTTDEMKTQAIFTNVGWDFDAIWEMTGDGYPYFVMPKTIDFDDLTLEPESAWNGMKGENGFQSRFGFFSNHYQVDPWEAWNGFAYSNRTDTEARGYGKNGGEFNAITGGGYDGSYIYAVAYVDEKPSITFDEERALKGAYFTNNNISYYSMLEGDDFAEPFDENDWLQVKVVGFDKNDEETGSLIFFLAKNGSIVDYWKWVDFEVLGAVKKLEFEMASSDTGEWGMNTPAYFCMDVISESDEGSFPSIEIDNVSIQYRTHENEGRDYYFGWVGFRKNGLPLAPWEVRDIVFRDSDGNTIDPDYGEFYYNKLYMYDCLSSDCIMSDLDVEAGFYFGFTGDFAEGEYQVEMETIYGQTDTVDMYYPGKLSLPVISHSTMESSYDNESDALVLSWTNPYNHSNWQHVDFLRVVLLDEMDRWILYVDVEAEKETAVIPADILDDAEAIHGTIGNRWFIQTRANDEAGVSYARGNSDFANYGYHIEWPFFQYRNYEDDTLDSYRGFFDVTKDGMPITEEEISGIAVRDLDGNEIGIFDEIFYPYEFYRYDCRGDTCREYGPESRSGFYFTFVDELAAGTYWLDIETDAGPTGKYVYYSGGLELPVINSASMSSGYEEGDLVLNWTNPVGHKNWDSVDQLRIFLFDEDDQIILFVEMNPDQESLTIPSDVIDTAEAIYGTTMVEWQIHTRAYDENWMDYARGYSDKVTLFGAPVTISGTVMWDGAGLGGVNILVSGGENTTADDNGDYTVAVNHGWSGTITPSLMGYTFLPENISYTDISGDQNGRGYTASLESYVISGRVRLDDKGLSGVILSGLPGSPETDEEGYFSAEAQHGWSGTVVPEKAGYAFVPESVDFEEIDGNKEDLAFAVTHIAGNQPPESPMLIQPVENAVVTAGEVTLEAGLYADPENDPHIRTCWQVIQSGSGETVYTHQSEFGTTVHVVPELESGVKYEWRAGYQDSGSGQLSWSDTESFLVGIQEEDQNVPPVHTGLDVADYRMLSVVHWPARPWAADVFGSMLDREYDPRYYRIGTYDPNKDGLGGYHEYPDFAVRPGEAYWVLARAEMTPNVTGVPVTLEHTVYIPLSYNPTAKDGWNMIGVPNNARYQWGDIHVMVRNAGGEVVFGPAPISDMKADNGYLDKRVWVWEEGRYRYADVDEFMLDPYAGYWVRAGTQHVFLAFVPEFQLVPDSQGQMLQGLLTEPQPEKSETDRQNSESGDASMYKMPTTDENTPPMPMREFGGPGEAGGGCFVETIAGDKR